MPKTLGVTLDSGDVDEAITAAVASGAIAIQSGTVTLGSGAAIAMTLAAPVAGARAAGGDDGKKIYVVAATAHAHTVTTPAAGINGTLHIATYAAIGDGVEFEAVNGVWMTRSLKGAVLS